MPSTNTEEPVLVDTISTLYEHLNDLGKKRMRKEMAAFLERTFKEDLKDKVERFLNRPALGVLPLREKFLQFWPKVVILYTNGLFYSTIVMCSIMAERMCYDLLEDSQLIVNSIVLSPKEKEKLFWMRWFQLTGLLYEWGLITEKTKANLNKIRKLRNEYVHPKTPGVLNPKDDAYEALKLVSEIIKTEMGPGPNARYAIQKGRLVRRKISRK